MNRRNLLPIEENTTLKELLLTYPKALRVLVDRQVPITCARGTVADAARACGLPSTALLAQLRAVAGQASGGYGVR